MQSWYGGGGRTGFIKLPTDKEQDTKGRCHGVTVRQGPKGVASKDKTSSKEAGAENQEGSFLDFS